MSKLPLDLSKFRKVKSDGKTSTFQHYEGHHLVIAHNKLSKKMREQLEKIPTKTPKKDKEEPQRFDVGGQVNPNTAAPQEAAPQEQPLQIEPIDPASPEAQPQQAPQAQVAPEPQAPPPPVTFEDHKQEAAQDLSKEDMAWQQDLQNGHITPKTYGDLFAKKDTLGKVGTLFGVLLSGAGAGLTHQPNAVLGMMQKEIDNDLEAQKQSKTNAQNFLRLNQQNLMNKAQIGMVGQQEKLAKIDTDAKAFALAQSQMLQSSYHHMVQEANKMPEGPQKEAAKQTLGLIYSKIGERVNNINDQAAGASAYSKMLFGNGSQQGEEPAFQKTMNGMRMLGPQGEARAKDLEEKHFPGLKGQASVPLSSGDREAINSGMEFDQKLHRFTEWTKGHSGDLSPSDRNEGTALAAELQGAYRQATHGGVYKEGEQNFISKLIDSEPTKFFNSIRVLPQLNAIAGENKARVNQLVKSKGFQGYEGAQSAQVSPYEGKTAVNSSGERITMKNGKWVPSGGR